MHPILRSLRDCFKSGQVAGKVGACLLLAALIVLIAGTAKAQQTGPIYCGAAASLAGFTTEAQVIAAPGTGSAKTYICGYTVSAVAASNVTFQYGTGTNCGTGSTAFGPTINLGATSQSVDSSPMFRGLVTPAGQAVCVTGSAAASITIYYVQE